MYITKLLFSATHMFAVVTQAVSLGGQIWRSPIPNADSSNIVWEKLLDLNGGVRVGGTMTSGGTNAYLREGSVVLDTDNDVLYALEYGSTVTGGPKLYRGVGASTVPASSFEWTIPKTFTGSKHGHALLVDPATSTLWATLGDQGHTDTGLWRATLAAPGTWSRVSIGVSNGGQEAYGINMRVTTRDGHRMILMEDDSRVPYGLLLHPTTTAQPMVSISLAPLPAPYIGTARGMHIASDGHIYFMTTGEGGVQGAFDAFWVWRFGDPAPVRLFSTPTPNAGTILNAVETANHVFIGMFRITKVTYKDEAA